MYYNYFFSFLFHPTEAVSGDVKEQACDNNTVRELLPSPSLSLISLLISLRLVVFGQLEILG